MLQRVSTFVPVVRLSKGQMGVKGHCCSFEQNVTHLYNELPWLPSDVELVTIIKKYKNDDKKIESYAFSIRKTAVLNALQFLVDYHFGYKDITINERNLS